MSFPHVSSGYIPFAYTFDLVGSEFRKLKRRRAEEVEQRLRTQRQLEEHINSDIVKRHPQLRIALGRIVNDLKRPTVPQQAGPEGPSSSQVQQ